MIVFFLIKWHIEHRLIRTQMTQIEQIYTDFIAIAIVFCLTTNWTNYTNSSNHQLLSTVLCQLKNYPQITADGVFRRADPAASYQFTKITNYIKNQCLSVQSVSSVCYSPPFGVASSLCRR